MLSEQNTTDRIKIFVCYAREDLDYVLSSLSELYDDRVEFLQDLNDIMPSEPWIDRIDNLIASADAVLFFATQASVASDECRRELKIARLSGKRIFPVLTDSELTERMPEDTQDIQWFLPDSDGGLDYDALREALLTDIDWVRSHTGYLTKARDWQNSGKSRSRLLRGRDVKSAYYWMASRPTDAPPILDLQKTYISASRRTLRTNRGLRILAVVLVVLGVLVFVNENRWTYSERLAEIAQGRLDASDPSPLNATRLALVSRAIEPFSVSARRSRSVEVIAQAVGRQRLRRTINADDWPIDRSDRSIGSLTILPSGESALVSTFRKAQENAENLSASDGSDPPDIDATEKNEIERNRSWKAHIVNISDNTISVEVTFPDINWRLSDGSIAKIRDATASSDGQQILWPLSDGRAFYLDLSAGTEAVGKRLFQKYVEEAYLFPDGKRVLVIGQGARVIDLADDDVTELVPATHFGDGGGRLILGGLGATSVSADGSLISLSVGMNGNHPHICVFSSRTGEEIKCTKDRQTDIRPIGADFSPDNSILAYGVEGGSVRLWTVDTGSMVELQPDAGGLMQDVAFSPNGKQIAVANSRNTLVGGDHISVVVMSLGGQRLVMSDKIEYSQAYQMVFERSGKNLVVRGGGSDITIWDVNTGLNTEVITMPGDGLFNGFAARYANYSDAYHETYVLQVDRATSETDDVLGCITPPCRGYERSFAVYNENSIEPLRTLDVSAADLLQVSVSDTSNEMAVALRNSKSVELYRYADFSRLNQSFEFPHIVSDVHMARHYPLLAVGTTTKQIFLQSTISYSDASSIEAYGVTKQVVLSPNGRFLAAVSRDGEEKDDSDELRDNVLEVWDLERGGAEPLLRKYFPSRNRLSRRAFARHKPRFTYAYGKAYVYDFSDEDPVQYMTAHGLNGLQMLTASISDSGNIIATTEDTGPVGVWDVESEEPIHQFSIYAGLAEFGGDGWDLVIVPTWESSVLRKRIGVTDENIFRLACLMLPEAYRNAPSEASRLLPLAGIFTIPVIDCESFPIPGPRASD